MIRSEISYAPTKARISIQLSQSPKAKMEGRDGPANHNLTRRHKIAPNGSLTLFERIVQQLPDRPNPLFTLKTSYFLSVGLILNITFAGNKALIHGCKPRLAALNVTRISAGYLSQKYDQKKLA